MSEYLFTSFGTIQAEACDYNGHFNEAQSLVLLTTATDTLLDLIGLDAAGREKLQYSAFTVQNQLHYRAEAHLDDCLFAETRLIGFDSKRLRIYHRLLRESDQQLIVEMEGLLLGVDMESRQVAPWPEAVLQQLRNLSAQQADLPLPEVAGRGIEKPPLNGRV